MLAGKFLGWESNAWGNFRNFVFDLHLIRLNLILTPYG